MDSYKIRWKKSAVKELKKIEKSQIKVILSTIEQLQKNPLPKGAKKLTGSQITFRIRKGDYRIIYDVYPDELMVIIIRIRHRKDAYEP